VLADGHHLLHDRHRDFCACTEPHHGRTGPRSRGRQRDQSAGRRFPEPLLHRRRLSPVSCPCTRYDAENAFFAEDFAELVAAGYLKAPLPERLGGAGLSLSELASEQRQLAYWAPATALAVNMHLYWVGSAADASHAASPTWSGCWPTSLLDESSRQDTGTRQRRRTG